MTPAAAPNPAYLSYLQTAKTLARRAGLLIRQYRHPADPSAPSLSIDSKSGPADLVTNADIASQALIFSGLAAAHPTHLLIGEESTANQALTDEPTWIVDAIDGTTNYVCGLPSYCVSIALAIARRPVAAAVYNPAIDEMFAAAHGHGAFLNEMPLRARRCPRMGDALVLTEWGYVREEASVDAILAANRRLIARGVRGVRQIGSGALDLCYVAACRADAVYTGVAGEQWHIWDYAAGALVAEEAGAKLVTLTGEKFDVTARSMACATPELLPQILAAVNDEPPPDVSL